MFLKKLYMLMMKQIKKNYFIILNDVSSLGGFYGSFLNVHFLGGLKRKIFNKYLVVSFNVLSCQKSLIDNTINISFSFFDIKYFILGLLNSLMSFLGSIILIVCLLICIAYYTLLERKLMSAMQRRKGPNVVGFYGFLQPLADGLKLFIKQMLIPMQANKFLFVSSSIYTFAMALGHWVVMPINPVLHLTNLKFGLLYSMVFLSLNVYGLIVSGWSSNSKYAFLGSIRATAQMISYELALGFILLIVFAIVGDLNYYIIILSQKKIWFLLPLLPVFYVFIVIMLAETNRTPFDLAEAEAELVAGFNVEYSGILFALFFLAEYSNMLIMAILGTFLFLGGWFFFNICGYINFLIKILFFAIVYIWVRATLPRYRYDQLMAIGWKIFLPFMLAFFFFVVGILVTFNMLPLTQENPFIDQKLLTLFYMNKPIMLDPFSSFELIFNSTDSIYIIEYLLYIVEENFKKGSIFKILFEQFYENFFSTPYNFIRLYTLLVINDNMFTLAVDHSVVKLLHSDEFNPVLDDVFNTIWVIDFLSLLLFQEFIVSPDLSLVISIHVFIENYFFHFDNISNKYNFIQFIQWRDFHTMLLRFIMEQYYINTGKHDASLVINNIVDALFLHYFKLDVVPIDVLRDMNQEIHQIIGGKEV